MKSQVILVGSTSPQMSSAGPGDSIMTCPPRMQCMARPIGELLLKPAKSVKPDPNTYEYCCFAANSLGSKTSLEKPRDRAWLLQTHLTPESESLRAFIVWRDHIAMHHFVLYFYPKSFRSDTCSGRDVVASPTHLSSWLFSRSILR